LFPLSVVDVKSRRLTICWSQRRLVLSVPLSQLTSLARRGSALVVACFAPHAPKATPSTKALARRHSQWSGGLEARRQRVASHGVGWLAVFIAFQASSLGWR